MMHHGKFQVITTSNESAERCIRTGAQLYVAGSEQKVGKTSRCRCSGFPIRVSNEGFKQWLGFKVNAFIMFEDRVRVLNKI